MAATPRSLPKGLTYRYVLPVILYLSLLIYLTLRSQEELPKWDIPFIDKIAHFGLFFILALLFVRLLVSGLKRETTWKICVCAFALATLYGAIDEFWIQPMASGRHLDSIDFVFNTVGALVGASLTPIYQRLKTRP